ncbi:fluoride efflux transporter CrcB [Marinicella litoralis]|uniref:Fluoride-specific ion channel FluC n=1 Tax=Marinicella litoralis TaxID=644220 RepID=A0A4R6Y0I2_9GAMM|nr:fluoride efflux transporter CrcB [Marinicella litoralis]TDR22418.1 camphor resistance protein CrcB [Marinicella litoralis]
MINSIIAVAIGGALGASVRFGINQLALHALHVPLFWATLMVNVVGCFLMGMAFDYFNQQAAINEALRLFITVGLLGALTTWSTFSMETVLMIQNDQLFKAIAYTLVTTVCCFFAFWLGVKS